MKQKILKQSKLAFSIAAIAAGLTALPVNAQIEEIVVTANKREQSIQDVSTSVTALNSAAIENAGIIDISGLETLVPGLRIGTSGSEVRPALRGARTNEVGVAGTGIAEQVVGIFQDGIYSPTTTSGLGAYVDVERIEVLRGPQGTLYGRNTFAGSINIVSKAPDFDELSGSVKVLKGRFDRSSYEAVLNLPVSDSFASRLVIASDSHDGIITNHFADGKSDDLRDRNRFYLRSTNKFILSDELEITARFDYSDKDQNADAIWGYQQIAARQVSGDLTTGFSAESISYDGHVYAGTVLNGSRGAGDLTDIRAARQDLGPYDVYRNTPSVDQQKTYSTTLGIEWTGMDVADAKFTLNFSRLDGTQFYDANYSEARGFNFGRTDEQDTYSVELQLTSKTDGPLSWVGGLYYFDQEAEWQWLTNPDFGGAFTPNFEITRCCLSSGDGVEDPHTVTSFAVYGQATYSVSEDLRVIAGLRLNNDDKSFTQHGRGDTVPQPPEWDDSAVLWKAAIEYDVSDNTLAYASVATGLRTGGANEPRAAAAGSDLLYDNEEVISYEIGLKNTLLNNTMNLNISAFANTYEDVKAQLFVRGEVGVDPNTGMPQSLSFEYYENGGDVDSFGIEAEMLYQPTDKLTLSANIAYLNSEFGSNYAVGSATLRPLLGLGNIENRQDVTIAAADLTDQNSQFSFAGWAPALSPEITIGGSIEYVYDIEVGRLGDTRLTPSFRFRYVDDYYAFDTNIPEVLQDSHVMADFRLAWELNDGDIRIDAFIENLFDEEVLTRAVVHNRGIVAPGEGTRVTQTGPTNSVQANWNNPRTWGVSIKYNF